MDEQEYKEQLLKGQKKQQEANLEKFFIYITAFAIAMIIFSILRIFEVSWTMNRSLTECICYLVGAVVYLIIFFSRKKIAKLIVHIRNKFKKEK
ncbi:MAG: hypothetical protein E7658_03880 [Ruminococcaceae bacterium]|nr:hypothetical protein [Oscillospiraceae bacterium]